MGDGVPVSSTAKHSRLHGRRLRVGRPAPLPHHLRRWAHPRGRLQTQCGPTTPLPFLPARPLPATSKFQQSLGGVSVEYMSRGLGLALQPAQSSVVIKDHPCERLFHSSFLAKAHFFAAAPCLPLRIGCLHGFNRVSAGMRRFLVCTHRERGTGVYTARLVCTQMLRIEWGLQTCTRNKTKQRNPLPLCPARAVTVD